MVKCIRIVFVISLLFSCTKSAKQENSADFVLLTDDLGREVKIKKDSKRFLPFAPSVTEILYLFCDTSEIVGRTQNCNYPPQALAKPVVNNYPPDLEKILLLQPDLLITKDGMLSLSQAESIEKMGVPVYFQKYDSVRAIFRGINKLARITRHEEKGKKIVDSLVEVLKQDGNRHDVVSGKKVLMLISKENYFCFGKNTYASDIIEHCGARNAVDSLFDNPYPMLTGEYIMKVNPDVILGGAPVGLHEDFFELHKELKKTTAYKTKQYYTIDEDYLSRPGPRVVEAILYIHSLIEEEGNKKK